MMQKLAEILSPFPGAIKSETENRLLAQIDIFFLLNSHCKDSRDLAAVGMLAFAGAGALLLFSSSPSPFLN